MLTLTLSVDFAWVRAKVSKYGDRVLETIELTLEEFRKTSGGVDSGEAVKRRRNAAADPRAISNWEDDITGSMESQSTKSRRIACVDLDLDGPVGVKPPHLVCSPVASLFDEYVFKRE